VQGNGLTWPCFPLVLHSWGWYAGWAVFSSLCLQPCRHLYESADEDQPSASSTSAAAAGSGSSSGWPPPSGAAQNGTSCFVDEEDPPPAAEFGAVLPQSFVPGQPLGPQVEVELAVNGCRGGGSGLKHSSSGGQRASSAGKAGGGAESLATPAAGAVVLGEADVADLDGEEVLLVGTRSSVKVGAGTRCLPQGGCWSDNGVCLFSSHGSYICGVFRPVKVVQQSSTASCVACSCLAAGVLTLMSLLACVE
jgi:hypothetical protein